MMMHKGRPMTTTLLPGDEPARAFPAVRDSDPGQDGGVTITAARRRFGQAGLNPELIKQAVDRIAQPDPSAPTLVVAAFQSSI